MDLNLQGNLSLVSLFNSLPSGVLVPTRKSKLDPYRLGWRTRLEEIGTSVAFSGLFHSSASSLLATACLIKALERANGHQSDIQSDTTSEPWLRASGLYSIAAATRITEAQEWINIRGCYILPIFTPRLQEISDINRICLDLGNHIRSLEDLLDEWNSNIQWEEIADSASRVAKEALLNILEHAHPPEHEKTALICLTLSPTNQLEELNRSIPGVGPKHESSWLSNIGSTMLVELAIADTGYGIPRTIWKDADAKGVLNTSALAERRQPGTERKKAQDKLCDYAFHHASTQKTKFESHAAKLNWRGLNRCLRQVQNLGGCLSLYSGGGAAGFASISEELLKSRHLGKQRLRKSGKPSANTPPMVFPGTMVSLIFAPNEITKPRSTLKRLRTTPLRPTSIGVVGAGQRIDWETRSNSGPTLLAFKFQTFNTVEDVLEIISKSPPQGITFLHQAILDPTVASELRAPYTDALPKTEHISPSLPRIVAYRSSDSRQWKVKIAGAVPTPTDLDMLYSTLEKNKMVLLEEFSPVAQEQAKDLALAYPEVFSIKENNKQLILNEVQPELNQTESEICRRLAFTALANSARASRFIYSTTPNKPFQLPTGRYVTRFFSVLKLLQNERTLAIDLQERFETLIATENSEPIEIIADSQASSLIASALLQTSPKPNNITLLQSAKRDRRHIVFFDVVYRGDTLSQTLKELAAKKLPVEKIIIALDMRALPPPIEGSEHIDVISLLHWNPGQINAEQPPKTNEEREAIIQIDNVNHVPLLREKSSEFRFLGTTLERTDFAREHKDIFKYKLHKIGNRPHLVSVNTQLLASNHAKSLSEWLSTEAASAISGLEQKRIPKTIIVFFRQRSAVRILKQEIAIEIGRKLSQSSRATSCKNLRVLYALLPSVRKDHSQVFPRTKSDILDTLTDPLGLGLREPLPKGKIAAVYIDDAAVSGNSIRDFLSKACSFDRPEVAAIIALTIVNRLSPSESRFLDLCSNLSPTTNQTSRKAKAIPFRYYSLFRLQVRSATATGRIALDTYIRELTANNPFIPSPVRNYHRALQISMRNKISYMFEETGTEPREQIFLPSFALQDDSPVSTLTVELRHLVSLKQQNEIVTHELYDCLNQAIQTRDFDILTVFCYEPNLLDETPFDYECNKLIRNLAIEAFEESDNFRTIRNALIVLGTAKTTLYENLSKIVPVTLSSPDLTSLLISILHQDTSSEWKPYLVEAISRINQGQLTNTHEASVRLLRLISVSTERRILDVDGHQGALRAIRNLVTSTLAHSDNLDSWITFSTGLRIPIGANTYSNQHQRKLEVELQKAAEACLHFTKSTLLPSLKGLQYLAEDRGLIQASETCYDSFWEACLYYQQLSTIVAQNNWRSKQADACLIFDALKSKTLTLEAPSKFISECNDEDSPKSTIEDVLPKLFTNPVDILTRLAEASRISIDSNITVSNMTVLCPEECRSIEKLLGIFMENLHLHGIPDTCRVSIAADQHGRRIVITFQNEKKPHDTRRGGGGLRVAEQIASSSPCISIKLPETTTTIQFKVEVTISECMFITSV